jgi:hypothetical protein
MRSERLKNKPEYSLFLDSIRLPNETRNAKRI